MRESIIRQVARSSYWQNFYSNAKELNLSLFNNNTSLSKIQLIFLNYLSMYNTLFQDLALKEDYISEEVIKDDIRTDAYLLWKKRVKYNKKKKKKDIDEENTLGIPSVKFTD